jgi:iron(III) transport system substrate-binding protein
VIKKIIVFFSFILLAFSFTSCTDSKNTLDDIMHKQTPQQKTLNVLCVFQNELYCKVQTELFEKQTGIKTSFTHIKSFQEAKDNILKYDVLYGGDVTYYHGDLYQYLQPYVSKYSKPISPDYKSDGGYYTGVDFSPIIFCSNKQRLNDIGVLPPTSWNDLLDTDYKNKVVFGNPKSSGVAYSVIFSYYAMADENFDATKKYFQNLDKNIPYYPAADDVNLLSNKVATAVTLSYKCLQLIDLGHPYILTYPTEGTSYVVDGVSITKAANNLDSAKQFVDFVLDDESQEVSQLIGTYQLPVNPNIPLSDQNKNLLNIKTIDDFSLGVNDNRENALKFLDDLGVNFNKKEAK